MAAAFVPGAASRENAEAAFPSKDDARRAFDAPPRFRRNQEYRIVPVSSVGAPVAQLDRAADF